MAPTTYGDGSILPDSPASVRFLGAPSILSVLPQTVVAGHTLVVSGENLTDVFWKHGRRTCRADRSPARRPHDDGAAGPARYAEYLDRDDAPRTRQDPTRSRQARGDDTGRNRSIVDVIFVVGTNGFGMGVGEGLFGAVYALSPNAINLPNFGDPRKLIAACNDPLVRSDITTDCPFNTIVVPNLDVPMQQFTVGFPGVAETLIEFFAIRFRGVLTLEHLGTYGFRLCSDDGSNLYVGSANADAGTADADASGLLLVVGNDGVHEDTCKTGSIDVAAPGTLPVVCRLFPGSEISHGP